MPVEQVSTHENNARIKLGQQIKRWRKAAKKTIMEMAELANMPTSTWASCEAGRASVETVGVARRTLEKVLPWEQFIKKKQ